MAGTWTTRPTTPLLMDPGPPRLGFHPHQGARRTESRARRTDLSAAGARCASRSTCVAPHCAGRKCAVSLAWDRQHPPPQRGVDGALGSGADSKVPAGTTYPPTGGPAIAIARDRRPAAGRVAGGPCGRRSGLPEPSRRLLPRSGSTVQRQPLRARFRMNVLSYSHKGLVHQLAGRPRTGPPNRAVVWTNVEKPASIVGGLDDGHDAMARLSAVVDLIRSSCSNRTRDRRSGRIGSVQTMAATPGTRPPFPPEEGSTSLPRRDAEPRGGRTGGLHRVVWSGDGGAAY